MLVQDAKLAKQSGSSNVTNCWAPLHFEQDPSSPFELFVRQPASDPMVLEVGLLSGHRGATEQPGTSPPMFTHCWVPPRFEQDPTSLGEAIDGGQPVSDQMVLEAGLLSGPRGATTPPSGIPGNGKDGRPSLRHEVTSDAEPTTRVTG
jgi:hypothetical protein